MGVSTIALASMFINCIAMGTTTGTRMDIVAQDEPVEKLIAAAVRNVTSGKKDGDKTSAEILTRN